MATKRKFVSSPTKNSSQKKKRMESSEYSSDNSADDMAFPDWPAPQVQMDSAREFIKDCAAAEHLTLLVPDKDGKTSP